MVALCALAACGQRAAAPSPGGLDLHAVPLSRQLAAQIRRERAPAPRMRPGGSVDPADVVARFLDLSARIQHPATRMAAGDELYAAWRGDPTNFLWIELGARYEFLLHRRADRDAMYALPVLADTTSAVGAYVQGRRFYGFRSKGEEFRRAEAAREQLDPLQQAWLTRMVAMADRDGGDGLAAADRLVGALPAARACGGDGLTSLYWMDIAESLLQADRLDDALHAASLACELAAVRGDAYWLLTAKLLAAEVLEARDELGAALDLYQACAREGSAADFAWIPTRSLTRAGTLCGSSGDYPGKISFHRQAMLHCLATGDSVNAPRAMMNVANGFRAMGQLDSCLTYQRWARRVVEAYPNERNRAGLAMREAEYFCHIGDYQTADSLLALAEGSPAGMALATEEADLLLGLIEEALGSADAGAAYRAIARLEQLRPRLHDARSDQNLLADLEIATARFTMAQGEVGRAAEALDRARAAVESGGGETQRWKLERASGELAASRADLVAARDAFARCVQIGEAMGAPALAAEARIELARALLQSGMPGEARELLQPAASAGRWGEPFRARLSSLLVLGSALAQEGRHREALEVLQRALRLCLPQSPHDLVAQLCIARGRSLMALEKWAPARDELQAALGRLTISPPAPSSLELRALHPQAQREAVELLMELELRSAPPNTPSACAATTLALAVRGRGSDANAELSAARAASVVAEVIARPRRGPLLVYFVGEAHTFRWWIEGGVASLTTLPGRVPLLERLSPVLLDLGNPDALPDTAAVRGLARVLLGRLPGSVDTAWPAGSPLTLIPDDVLQAVPWAALPLAAAGIPGAGAESLVLDRGPVVEATSLLQLAGAPAAAATRRDARGPQAMPILAVGVDVVPDASGSAMGVRRLRHAEAEAREVASLWPAQQARVLLGPQATWDQVLREELARYGALHIASHAVVHHGRPDRSTLRLFGRQGTQPVTPAAVVGLRLGADLVYLSSCESARGPNHGVGGVTDFVQAFLRAGASNVIAPTVPVEDRAARALAVAFYRNWRAGVAPAAALREAQRELRDGADGYRHPFYWAFYRCVAGSADAAD